MKNNIVRTEPVYIKKLLDRKITRLEVARICGISPPYIGQCVKENSIRKSFEDLAKIYYERRFTEQDNTKVFPEPKVKHKEEPEDAVLMVVLKKNNVDFLTRIVRSLKGEITEV